MLQRPSENLCRRFSLAEIKSATNCFDDESVVGRGSFGLVYKGIINVGAGYPVNVAVKRLSFESRQGAREFWTEVQLLPSCRHSNLISLIGYCVDYDENEMILVYEFMSNGTLADHIYKNNENSCFLSWEKRLNICVGVARGLQYLHTGTGVDQKVIHRDLKGSNILLDANWVAKISDLGLCKMGSTNLPCSPIKASVKGTVPYMDPVYRATRELSRKTDVYAFGVVLLEVLCGRRALDFEVVERQKRLVLWAQQCIREGVVHRIIDPGLRGRISEDGLRIFIDIAQKCLQDRPKKRPTMAEVVAKLESALASQYATYSSSVDDEFVKIFSGHEACMSSSGYTDVDPLRPASENGSAKSDTNKHDLDSEPSNTTFSRRCTPSKSSLNEEEPDVLNDLQSKHVNGEVSMNSSRATAATFETSIGSSHDKDDEYEKLFRRMNPPRVAIENGSFENGTVIKVDSANTQGLLLEIVQVLTDFNLIITKASRTFDGSWFMDVFSVTDQEGNNITDKATLRSIQEEALRVYSSSPLPIKSTFEDRSFPNKRTIIELTGNDRPGLLYEISAIITNLNCNVVNAEIWSHNTRIAALMQLCDPETGAAIIESERLSEIEKLLSIVLKGGNISREANITITHGCTCFDRRLHQMMLTDRDYERDSDTNLIENPRPDVRVVNWSDKDYSLVSVQCKDRSKLLFDILCTLTDLNYFVFHGNIDTEAPDAFMEFWIRHADGSPLQSDAERQRVVQCLRAAIERRGSEGLKIKLHASDRVGLLSDITHIILEHSLTITRAELTTKGGKAVDTFYVADPFGHPVDPKIMDSIRKTIGQNILQVEGRTDSICLVQLLIKLWHDCFGLLHFLLDEFVS